MSRRFLALVFALLSLAPTAAFAQRTGGEENPVGFVLPMGVGVSAALAAPVWLVPGSLPRPGDGRIRLGVGYQSAPHSIASPSSAGGYFGFATWLGLEGRTILRVDGETGIDFKTDTSYLVLVRPTPVDWPFWIELMAGGGFESGFGENWPAFIQAGPTGGLRLGASIPLASWIHLVIEGEGLYNARYGTAIEGRGDQLEIAASATVMFDGDPAAPIGVGLEYRQERPIGAALNTLPESHAITVSGVLSW